jgi:peptidoglycan/LPS O-acetylase OafA/YrhL
VSPSSPAELLSSNGYRVNNSETEKYDYIDALRGLAIMGVVLSHIPEWVPPVSFVLNSIAAQGARGVQLFYLASALTLFMSMASRIGREEKATASFFIRRFFRIAPAFYLAVVIYFIRDGMSPRYVAPNGIQWWYVPLTVFFLNGWHPETINSVIPGGWSIAIEMTFYLFVPYLFSKLNAIKPTLIALLASIFVAKIASSAITTLLIPLYPYDQQYLVGFFSYEWFFSQLPVFLLGILAFHLIRKYPTIDKSMASFLLVSSLLLFAAFLIIQTYENLLPQHILYGIAFLLFALSLHYSPQKLFVNRLTVLVGRISFSIYLFHFLILSVLENFFSSGFPISGNLGFGLAYALLLALSICISYVTHRVIEVPGINLGKRIIKKLVATQPVVVTSGA